MNHREKIEQIAEHLEFTAKRMREDMDIFSIFVCDVSVHFESNIIRFNTSTADALFLKHRLEKAIESISTWIDYKDEKEKEENVKT